MEKEKFNKETKPEFIPEERLPLIRDEQGNILEIQKGENPAEKIVEMPLRNLKGEITGKSITKYQCLPGERVGLHREMNLFPKKAMEYDLNGKILRQYAYEYNYYPLSEDQNYPLDENWGKKEGEYSVSIERKDIESGNTFKENEFWEIKNGKLLPSQESFGRNGKLLSFKDYTWDDQGNLTYIKILERDNEGNLLQHTETEIRREGDGAWVKEYQADKLNKLESTGPLKQVAYNEAVGQVFGKVIGRIKRER